MKDGTLRVNVKGAADVVFCWLEGEFGTDRQLDNIGVEMLLQMLFDLSSVAQTFLLNSTQVEYSSLSGSEGTNPQSSLSSVAPVKSLLLSQIFVISSRDDCDDTHMLLLNSE